MRSCNSHEVPAPTHVPATTLELYEGWWPRARIAGRRCASMRPGCTTALAPDSGGLLTQDVHVASGPRWWLRYEHMIRHGGRKVAPPARRSRRLRTPTHTARLSRRWRRGSRGSARRVINRARVIVCDEQSRWGGLPSRRTHRRIAVPDWIAATVASLAAREDVTLLSARLRSLVRRQPDRRRRALTDHLSEPPRSVARQRMWKIRAKSIVLASGASSARSRTWQRPPRDDARGRSADGYVEDFASAPDARAVVFANNAPPTPCLGAAHRGVNVAAVVDARVLRDRQGTRCASTALRCGLVQSSLPLTGHAASVPSTWHDLSTPVNGSTATSSAYRAGTVRRSPVLAGARDPSLNTEIAAFIPDRSPIRSCCRRRQLAVQDLGCARRRACRGLRGAVRAATHGIEVTRALCRDRRAAAADMGRACAPQAREALRRPAERRDCRRYRARRARELPSVEHLNATRRSAWAPTRADDTSLSIALMADALGVTIERVWTDHVPFRRHGHAGHDRRGTIAATPRPTRYCAVHDCTSRTRPLHPCGLWKRPHRTGGATNAR